MRDHPNAAVVRRGYEAMQRGDPAALAAVVAPGSLPAVLAALDPPDNDDVVQSWSLVPLAVAAAGAVVVVIDHVCARRGGRPLDAEGVAVFAVVDGCIVEAHRVCVTHTVGSAFPAG